MNYIEFDRLVESSLSQRIKYASGQDEKLRVLSDVLENRKV